MQDQETIRLRREVSELQDEVKKLRSFVSSQEIIIRKTSGEYNEMRGRLTTQDGKLNELLRAMRAMNASRVY